MISIALSGQRDNVGDTLHRRILLDYLRPLGELHVHVGDVPPSFLAGLRLDGSETLYTSSASWLQAAHRKASPDSLLVFSPGEMRLGASRARREMMLAPTIARLRRRGGRVARLGIAAGSKLQFSSRLAENVLRSAIARTDVLAWREPSSQRLFGAGHLIPDLGFGIAGEGLATTTMNRSKLVLTMRFDRPYPPPAWLKAIRNVATHHGLQILVPSQVRRDDARSQQLASDLDADWLPWPDERDHWAQECYLRELYRDTALMVSDRLHALILAATEGAAIAAFSPLNSQKLPVHFQPLGLTVESPSTNASSDEVEQVLLTALETANTQRLAVKTAHAQLSSFIPASLATRS